MGNKWGGVGNKWKSGVGNKWGGVGDKLNFFKCGVGNGVGIKKPQLKSLHYHI